MQLNTSNEPRAFEVLKTVKGETAMLPLMVRQLTLRQLKKTGAATAEYIKSKRRAEFLAVARELPAESRDSFLVASAKSNMTVTQEEMAEVSDTPYGIINVLQSATDLTEPELQELLDEPMNIETLDLARYYALGLDVDQLIKDLEELDTEAEKQETKTEATFPECKE